MLCTKLHVQLLPTCSSPHCSFKGYRLQEQRESLGYETSFQPVLVRLDQNAYYPDI